MKKEVLFLMDRMDSGGVPRVLLNLLDYIDQDKFSITVALTCKNDTWEGRLPSWVEVIHLFGTAPNRSNLRFVRFMYLIFQIIVPGRIIQKLFFKRKYDVFIDFFGTMFGFWKGAKAKKLVWLHKDFSYESNPLEKRYFENHRGTTRYKILKHLEQKSFGNCDNIVLISNTMRNSFIERFGFENKIRVCYNPIDEKTIRSMAEKEIDVWSGEGPLFCAMTRVSKGKGCERLLRCYKRLLDEGYKFRLLIVGGGDGLYELYTTYNNLNLNEKHVRIIGAQENPFCYLSNSDIFISPSETEAFCMSLAEAIILEMPIITTNVGSAKELLSESEFGLVVENSEEGIYQGLKLYLDEPDIINKYRTKIKELSKVFNIDTSVKAIEMLIEE